MLYLIPAVFLLFFFAKLCVNCLFSCLAELFNLLFSSLHVILAKFYSQYVCAFDNVILAFHPSWIYSHVLPEIRAFLSLYFYPAFDATADMAVLLFSQELRGEVWSFNEKAIAFVNGELIGGPDDLIGWAENEHNFEEYRPEALYYTLTEEAYTSKLNSQKHDHVFLDVAINGEFIGGLVIEVSTCMISVGERGEGGIDRQTGRLTKVTHTSTFTNEHEKYYESNVLLRCPTRCLVVEVNYGNY